MTYRDEVTKPIVNWDPKVDALKAWGDVAVGTAGAIPIPVISNTITAWSVTADFAEAAAATQHALEYTESEARSAARRLMAAPVREDLAILNPQDRLSYADTMERWARGDRTQMPNPGGGQLTASARAREICAERNSADKYLEAASEEARAQVDLRAQTDAQSEAPPLAAPIEPDAKAELANGIEPAVASNVETDIPGSTSEPDTQPNAVETQADQPDPTPAPQTITPVVNEPQADQPDLTPEPEGREPDTYPADSSDPTPEPNAVETQADEPDPTPAPQTITPVVNEPQTDQPDLTPVPEGREPDTYPADSSDPTPEPNAVETQADEPDPTPAPQTITPVVNEPQTDQPDLTPEPESQPPRATEGQPQVSHVQEAQPEPEPEPEPRHEPEPF